MYRRAERANLRPTRSILVVAILRVVLCCVCAGVAYPQDASAQDASAQDASAQDASAQDASGQDASAQDGGREQALEDARQHMEEGQSRYQAGEFESAIHEFEAAYAAQPFSAFLYNAGVAAERLEQWSRAADFYERYLNDDPHSGDAVNVRRNVDALRTRALNTQPHDPIVTTTTTVEQHEVSADTHEATDADAADVDATDTADTDTADTDTADADADTDAHATDAADTDAHATDADAADATDADAADATDADAADTDPHDVRPNSEAGGIVPATAQTMKSLISVQTEPAGAMVTLRRAGQIVASGPSPFAHTLDEGEYALSIEHPDYRTVGERVRVRAGKVYVVIVEMSQGHFLGYLNVVTDPPGAQVFIDDREQGAAGTTPFRTVLDTGAHHVMLERPGFTPQARDVEVSIGAEISLQLQLTRVDYGRLRVVASEVHAQVSVDGEDVGEVPYEGQLAPGEHEVEIAADGMKTYSAAVNIERGQLTPVRVRLRPRPSRRTAWSTLVFGLGSAGAGIYLGLRGQDLRDQLRTERNAGTLASDDPRILRGRLFYYGADAAYGFGALMGVFSLYYFLRDPLPDSDGRVLETRDWSLMPSFDRSGAGAMLRGRF